MGDFLKGFGKGILYIFVLPFLIVILALYGAYGLIAFIVLFFRSIILFFSGRSLQDDLPEDIKAKEILEGPKVASETLNATPAPEKEPEPFSVYQPSVDPFSTKASTTDPYRAPTVEEGLFGKKEEKVEPKAEPVHAEEVIDESSKEIHTAEIAQEDIQTKLDEIEKPRSIFEDKNVETPVQEIKTSNEDVYKPLGEDDFDMNEIAKDDEIDDSLDSGVSFDDF